MSETLVELLPQALRAYPVDPVVTGLLEDDCEFVLEWDGRTVWIPTQRNTDPVFGGELVPGIEAVRKHMTMCGATGWRHRAKVTAFGVGDFDAKSGDHAGGRTPEELAQVLAAVKRAGWAWARRSKSGGDSFHVIAPAQPMPAATGEEHGHNLKAILNQLSADAGFDFRRFVCGTLNGWFWVQNPAPHAFEVLVTPTKPPPKIIAPPFQPQGVSESESRMEFTEEQREDLEIMRAAGFAVRVDGNRVAVHSKAVEAFVRATRPECRYESKSTGRHPSDPNAWMWPQPDGGWTLTRFDVLPEAETQYWHANAKGKASCTIPPRTDRELLAPIPVLSAEQVAADVASWWGLMPGPTPTPASAVQEPIPEMTPAPAVKDPAAAPESPPAPAIHEPASAAKDAGQKPAKKDGRLVIPLMTCRELDSSDYEEEYLIEGTLVKGQPGIVAGPQKGLKTSILMDMLVSLATETPFLGRIPVTRTCRSIFLSGESGISTLRRTGRRISKAKGVDFPSTDNLWISEFLPWFTDKKHLDGIERMIEEHAPEVVAIDPTYLCMSGADAGNLFAQGEKLRGIGQLCRRHGVCLLLAHHMRKQGKVRNASDFEPRELDDLAWSGFAEFMRQWALIGRREQYTPGSGIHKLWLTLGGSAGHSNLWAVDVDEGLVDNRPTAWTVSLASPCEARAEKKADTIRQRLLDAARNFPAGESKSAIIDTAKLRRDHATQLVFDSLVEDGLLLPCEIKKGGRSYEAFRLPEVKA